MGSKFIFSLAASAFLVLPAMAVDGYNVTAKAVDKEVQIRFESVERHNSICFLTPHSLTIELGKKSLVPSTAPGVGSISVGASTEPGTPCLAALGPHSGSITLPVNSALPSLPEGKYTLKINGSESGILSVGKDGNKLKVELK